MLSRNGLVIPVNKEIKKQLTVQAVPNGFCGIRPKSFKVYREDGDRICVPQYFGEGIQKDIRTEPATIACDFRGELRDYQMEAVQKFFQTPTGGVLSLGCGLGKTCTALAIAARLGLRTMVIVHKEFLADQWRDRIRQFIPSASIGLVQGGTLDIEKDIVIGMIQTLCQRDFEPTTFDKIGFLVIDEAHHIGAPAFSQCMFRICTKYTLGLTATPERLDGLTRLLYWFLGPEFYRLEISQKATVIPYTYKDKVRTGVPMANIINEMVEDSERNKIILDIINKCQGRKVLVLSDRRAHCEFLNNNVPYSSLYMGGMSREELEQSARASVIIGTFSQAHEGLDIPDLDTLILATPKSSVKQAVGRILRGGSKNPPVIHDIRDTSMYGMWQKRRTTYYESGFTIQDHSEMPTKKWLGQIP
jgi:superfamily II DNA or RNA helicase